MSDPTDPTNIDQALRRLVLTDGLDPEIAADKALAEVTKAALADYVRPVIVMRAKGYARQQVRTIEDQALRPAPDPLPQTTAEARSALVSRAFPVPGKGMVCWSDATAEDHLSRAQWQRDHAARSITDAERHEAAAALIAEHGVATLGEIDNWSDLLGDQS